MVKWVLYRSKHQTSAFTYFSMLSEPDEITTMALCWKVKILTKIQRFLALNLRVVNVNVLFAGVHK